jgi:hypothetical protein
MVLNPSTWLAIAIEIILKVENFGILVPASSVEWEFWLTQLLATFDISLYRMGILAHLTPCHCWQQLIKNGNFGSLNSLPLLTAVDIEWEFWLTHLLATVDSSWYRMGILAHSTACHCWQQLIQNGNFGSLNSLSLLIAVDIEWEFSSLNSLPLLIAVDIEWEFWLTQRLTTVDSSWYRMGILAHSTPCHCW